jgi:hypothetical protein
LNLLKTIGPKKKKKKLCSFVVVVHKLRLALHVEVNLFKTPLPNLCGMPFIQPALSRYMTMATTIPRWIDLGWFSGICSSRMSLSCMRTKKEYKLGYIGSLAA